MKSFNKFLNESEKDKYGDAIKRNLDKIVSKEQSSQIMKNLFPKKITNYEKGEFYKYNEIKNIEKGDVIYFKYWDDDNKLRASEFGKVDTLNYIEKLKEYFVLSGGWEFGFKDKELESNDPVKRKENCGWHFSLYKAYKKGELKNFDHEASWD